MEFSSMVLFGFYLIFKLVDFIQLLPLNGFPNPILFDYLPTFFLFTGFSSMIWVNWYSSSARICLAPWSNTMFL